MTPRRRITPTPALSWFMAIGILFLGIFTSRLLTQVQSCVYFYFEPPVADFGAAGGTGQIEVSRDLRILGDYTGCAWGATSNVDWIVITSGASSQTLAGGGTLQYTVLQNSSRSQRTGTITFDTSGFSIGTYTITQAASSPPPLIVPSLLTFVAEAGTPGAQVPPKQLAVIGQDGGQFSFKVSTALATVGIPNWISVRQQAGVTPTTLEVSVNPEFLGLGSFGAFVILEADPEACQIPPIPPGIRPSLASTDGQCESQVVQVSATTESAPISVQPATLHFASPGKTSHILDVTSKATGLPNVNFGVFAYTSESAGDQCHGNSCWLEVDQPSSGQSFQTPEKITVTASPAHPGLSPETTHKGAIQVQDENNNGAYVQVDFMVGNAPTLNIGTDDSGGLSLTYHQGDLDVPKKRLIPVTSSSGELLFDAEYTSDTGWLKGPSGGETPTDIELKVNPSGLAVGTYSGAVTVSAPGAEEANLAVTLVVAPPASLIQTGIMSQIADSNEWQTTITLVNLDQTDAAFELWFHDGSGKDLAVPMGAAGTCEKLQGTIRVNGSCTFVTEGVSATLLQGWAEVSSLQSIGGVAIFRQTLPDNTKTEAAVPLTRSVSPRLFLPFDNSGGNVSSVALVNTDPDQGASVTATFRSNEDGSLITTETTIPLVARGHTAKNLLELQDVDLSNKRGVVEFSSSEVDLIGLGLRGSPNGTFTSLEPLVRPVPAMPRTLIGSRIVDGGGWRTTFILVNMGSELAPYTLKFWPEDNGQSLDLPLVGHGTLSFLSGTVEPNDVTFLQTEGTDASVSGGWVELNDTAGSIGGLLVLRQHVAGLPDSEVGVPLVEFSTTVRPLIIPFDNRTVNDEPFATSVAVENPAPDRKASIQVQLWDEQGTSLGTDTIDLDPRQQCAFNLRSKYQGTDGIRGTAEFSDPNGAMFGLGLRFGSSNRLTSIPALRK